MTYQISDHELSEIYDFAVQLGKDAGRILMDGAQARIGEANGVTKEQKQVEKDSSVDIVTQTDTGESDGVSLHRPIKLVSMLLLFHEGFVSRLLVMLDFLGHNF